MKWLILPLTLMLAACGLRPLYGTGEGAVSQAQLSRIAVSNVDERSGWLLRNAVVDRLGESSQAPLYRLDIVIDDDITRFGIRGDAAATRERRTLRARYQLVNLESGQTVLDATAGFDAGIDITSSEYATVAAEQTASERLAQEVADDMVARIALYLSRSGS